jgi:NAD(P)-dependent dehydrogenase (short-subunit alcohol dehydrogenase family)
MTTTSPDSTHKTILITGATSGIGRHAALHLARLGHQVIATGRNQSALEALTVEADGLRLSALRLDVTDPVSIADAVAHVGTMTNGHGVDVLVNNAGYGMLAPLSEITDEDLRKQFDTNVFGLMAVTRAFLPAMIARRSGRIVNVSSVGGRITFPFAGAYSASKYALESMSDALRIELRGFGIHVSVVEPGPIKTGFADASMSHVSRYDHPDSPYAAVMERAGELREQTDRMSVGPAVVSRAIERAALSRRPSARYVAPLRGLLVLGVLKAMPARLSDYLMRRVSHLDQVAGAQ